MSSRLRVAHAITGLGTGGAELILARLLERLGEHEFESRVISLTTLGDVGPQIQDLGLQVEALHLGRLPTPAGFASLRRAIHDFRPDVVQTWLLHANVMAGLAASGSSTLPVVWGVHITDVRREVHGAAAVGTRWLERRLARRLPSRIVACSYSSARAMADLGYPTQKIVTIPNGFDVERFRPDHEDRIAVRRELGISEEARVVGHVARFHPMKDHRNLLEAAERLGREIPGVELVLCGAGVTENNRELSGWVRDAGSSVRVHLLGPRGDVARLFRAFDVLALSSVGAEALPLVIGEGMASGLAVVATDCGDAAELIGDAGRVVPVSDPAALATGLAAVLGLDPSERAALGRAARRRIARDFSIVGMGDAYAEEWRTAARSGNSEG